MEVKTENLEVRKQNTALLGLRFPEFKEEARVTSLGAVAKFGSGGTPAKNEPSYWNGEIPWISASSMHDTFVQESELRVTSKAIGNGTRIAKKGTLLILVRGSMLFKRVPICLTLRDVAFNQDVKSLILDKGVNAHFLLSQLVAFEARFPINRTGIGAGKIDTDDLKSLTLFIPQPAEQQKIADCLGSLDDLIAAHSRKLAALQDHKKGLLQQLFPAEGETTPKLRFPEFEGAGEWKVKPLGELVNYQNGKAHEKEITESGSYISVNSKYISTEGKVVKRTNKALCMADVGDVLMVLSDVPNGKAIAKCYFVKTNNRYTVNQRICRLTPTGIVAKFLFYTLDKHKYFLAFDDGVKQTNLRKEDVLTCPIALPSEPEEQQKIADCLSDLDPLITAQTEQITGLKAHKKGLMQQLFPNPNLSKT